MDSQSIPLVVAILIFCIPWSQLLASDSWQINRLMHPQQDHLKQESKGAVFIYDGLYDSDVETALTDQFNRIEHMMFIRTKVLDNGVIEEADDCDD